MEEHEVHQLSFIGPINYRPLFPSSTQKSNDSSLLLANQPSPGRDEVGIQYDGQG
jgi:hypothetical protein